MSWRSWKPSSSRTAGVESNGTEFGRESSDTGLSEAGCWGPERLWLLFFCFWVLLFCVHLVCYGGGYWVVLIIHVNNMFFCVQHVTVNLGPQLGYIQGESGAVVPSGEARN